ncbi:MULTISPECIES: amino acid deaminase [unclassified Saccharopolyspora]|uniref:amino acid deaminase n=1 Tax=unclassified Saccharopolyspora TaxID=2646250 RepID=UPI001CD7B731|nr:MULTISPECIES: amino acid deaminase [unclassified Saccharopolyspora]MCA1189255.1 amino acid deaminase [Saccharopolyspora sp. 6T]MCA1196093.1 amino acid deaminase [Saccharopolyspora sp. 6V]MCA1228302.1 amino acid deaminase [Saccharopolyspora sp. 6M]MCA1283045.1 amino acid deaminase [Saccharopolyspora sp. 7B]
MSPTTPGIDDQAVSALRQDVLDWRYKGLPSGASGSTAAEFLATRPTLSGSGFTGPVLVLDEPALEHNLSTMARWCQRHGVLLAPHGKTTMAPRLFQRQLQHGAWGITAANVAQLRVYRAFGVRRVLLANQLLDPDGLRWLSGELDRDPEFEFSCWADSVAGVELMAASWTGERPLDVLVELGWEGARTGVRSVERGVEVARAVAASPRLRLAGVAGYEGAAAHGTGDDALATVDDYLARLRELVDEVERAGLFETAEIIVSGGGSAYFDQVAESLAAPWPTSARVLPVLRSGAYLTHDDGLYRRNSPFGRAHRLAGDESPFRPAMRVWAQVTSRPEPGLALATLGRRDVSFDQDLPEPQVVRGADGVVRELTGCAVTSLADQHAFLRVPEDGPRIGDWVGFGLSHPCTVFDKWRLIPVVDGDSVVDLVHTFF